MDVAEDELEETYLTVAEVAGMLKLNQQTVRNWIDQGSLPALRVGRRVRIKRSDFERIVADGYRSGAGASARDQGPSGEDFWSGGLVGIPEPDPSLKGGLDEDGVADRVGGRQLRTGNRDELQ
jgi:excisionase family DNA binding protein